MTDYEEKLRLYKTAYTQLQHSFKNNLNVIRQLQEQNSELQKHLQEMSLKYESQLEKTLIEKEQRHRKNLEQQQLEFAREVDLMKKQYQSFISSLSENEEKKNQQLITALTKKHKQQIQNIRTFMGKEIQAKQLTIRKSQSRCKSLEESLVSTQQKLNNLNVKVISMESELQRLHKQRQQTETLYSSKEQQLESIKQYSTSWQGTLKQRIKELQEQKSLVEEEMAEVKFSQRQKLKKLKDQHSKKITLLQETHAQRLNQTLLHSKEIKFKYESIKQENTELKTQNQYTKRELLQTKKLLQEQRSRFTSVQESILTVKQKEFQIKSMTEEIRRLQNQLKGFQQDKNLQKQQNQKINFQRENAQKALQRLKTQLLNKNRQCDEYKKQLDKVKYKNKVNSYQPQSLEQVMGTQAKGLARYEQKDAVVGGEVDYSKVFSDDMGGEDFKFLNSQIHSSPQKPPHLHHDHMQQSQNQQSIQNQHHQLNTTKVSHLMKRVGELQVQNQEYASTIKLIKEEMERTASTINDRLNLKDQEIRLGKNENMLLREKLNDKEQQLMRLKDNLRQLKQQMQKLSITKQSAQQLTQLRQQKQQLEQENKKLLSQVERLKENVADAIKQRRILQEIADQLRAEVNFYKDQFEYIQQERASQFTCSNLNQQQPSSYHHKNLSNSYEPEFTNNNTSNQFSQFNQSNQLYQAGSSNIRTNPNIKNHKPINNQMLSPNHNPLSSQNPFNLQEPYQNRSKSRQKSPQNLKPKQSTSNKGPKRKLHQLIKQKNLLQSEGALVMGRKANLQKRFEEQRVQHAGTKSQKQIYERLEKRSKSKSRQKSTLHRLKDYELAKPQRESSIAPVNKRSQRQQIGYNQQDQSVNEQASHIYQEVSQEMIEQSALMKRIQMMNRMKQSMGNQSLGEFDHLENVSMTYWDQQDHY